MPKNLIFDLYFLKPIKLTLFILTQKRISAKQIVYKSLRREKLKNAIAEQFPVLKSHEKNYVLTFTFSLHL